ncbi:MAG: cation transporter [Deltaproteobacteria bacterium]|nr:cation transporter [Deltaproteobacteria bacterium]
MSPELRAIRLALATSIVGAIVKFAAGGITGSMTLLSSAVDSFGDFVVSLMNLFVLKVAAQGPDAEHNYGHAKAEGLGAVFEGGFICSSGGYLIYESIHRAFRGERMSQSMIGIAVMIPLTALTAVTVLVLRRTAQKTGSLVIKADAAHYATDVVTNLGVLLALVLVHLTGLSWLDLAISVGLALYMIYSGLHVLRDGVDLVMDHSLPPDATERVRGVLRNCKRILSFHDLRTRAGRTPIVDVHIVVPGDTPAKEVHEVFDELQAGLRGAVGPETKLVLHADPAERQSPHLPAS